MNMHQIGKQMTALCEKVLEPGYQTTARDVALSAELINQYIDELARMETTVTVKERNVVIYFGDGKFKAEEQ